MTDDEFNEWLASPSEARCLLAEANIKSGASLVTRYLSTQAYFDGAANITYQARIAGGLKFTENISLSGDVSLSYGDIELLNTDGALDSWLNDYWVNREVNIYIGGPDFLKADFRKIFSGVASGIDTRNRDRVNIKLGDKLQRLNVPVSETRLGGSTVNSDKLIPLCFGECHNIEPLLTDPSVYEYQVHGGAIEGIIEVRDNGVPVSFTPYLSVGKFRLVNAPAGQITASIQGHKPSTYANDIVSIITQLVTNYGSVVANRLTSLDLDTTSLTTFQTAHPQPVGIYLKDKTNLVDACNQLTRSVGARVVMDKTGLLKLVKLTLPQSTSGTTITNADMLLHSASIGRLSEVQAAVKIGYCRNWTPQTSLAEGVLAQHADLFTQEWLTTTATDSTTVTNYNLFTEPDLEETLLLVASDATAEATRRLNVFKVQRKVFKYRGFARLMFEQLGNPQSVSLTGRLFGIPSGVGTGQIISVVTDWVNFKVEFEVLI
jgi:hypothetical protein